MLADLLRGDLVFVNRRASSVGSLGGDAGSWSADSGAGIECRVDEMSASEIAKYAADGMTVSHSLGFLSEPSLDVSCRLHWTKTNGLRTSLTGRWMHVQGIYREGDPGGETQYWVVVASLETTRGDA